MAREKIDIEVDAKVASAIANLTELVRAQGQLGAGAEEVGEKGRRAAKGWADELDSVIGRWASISKGIEIATAAVKGYIDARSQLRNEQVDATRAIDSGIIGYRIAQGNLGESAGLDAAGRITTVAQQNRASLGSAFAAASTLARYGVGRDQAEGSALSELLQLQDLASAQDKVDPSALTRGVLDLLQRSGRPITGQNIRGVGSAAFSLSQRVKGFDSGELGISADVAAYGRDQGFGLEETMAIVAALSEKYGEGRAKRRFTTLFGDQKFSLEERGQVTALRSRAAELLGGAGGGYSTAVAIAGGGMEDEAARAEAGYQASGFSPGIQDPNTVRKRLITALRQEGIGPWGQALVGYQYDILNWIGGPEFAIGMTAPVGIGKDAGPNDDFSHRFQRRVRERSLGQQEMTVRLLGPDGRDVPAEVGAEGLNTDTSHDATQSTNFRP